MNFYVLAPSKQELKARAMVNAIELQAVRQRVFWATLLPWVVMGVAQVVGGVPSVWSFFRPQDLNPYVWSWYVTIFVDSCFFTYWVFFRGGAKFALALNLVHFHFFGREVPMTEKWVKVSAALGPPFTIAWVFVAWNMNVSIPR
jgi:hypothetical protein